VRKCKTRKQSEQPLCFIGQIVKKNNFDLKSWWNQEKVQEVRRDFLKNYCNSLHDWPNEWMTKLSIINKQI
jgi:hypothetical protein